MNYKTHITDAEMHQAVKNKANMDEREFEVLDGGSTNNTIPGLEEVEGYEPSFMQNTESSSFESYSQGEEVLAEAWTASYDANSSNFGSKTIIHDGQAMERIIGKDDRVQIRNTKAFPYRAICRLLIEAKNGKRYLGTGWLVNSRTIITAGHNIYLHKVGGWAKSVTVIPGMNGSTMPFGSIKATALRSVKGWVKSRKPDSDYGAIILPKNGAVNIGNHYFKVAEATSTRLRGRYLNISGYPGDKGGKTQWYHARPVQRITRRRFFYTIDTMGGHSGSPVFVKAPNGARIALGIHAYGSSTENSATRFIKPILRNIIRWKNQGR